MLLHVVVIMLWTRLRCRSAYDTYHSPSSAHHFRHYNLLFHRMSMWHRYILFCLRIPKDDLQSNPHHLLYRGVCTIFRLCRLHNPSHRHKRSREEHISYARRGSFPRNKRLDERRLKHKENIFRSI